MKNKTDASRKAQKKDVYYDLSAVGDDFNAIFPI